MIHCESTRKSLGLFCDSTWHETWAKHILSKMDSAWKKTLLKKIIKLYENLMSVEKSNLEHLKLEIPSFSGQYY